MDRAAYPVFREYDHYSRLQEMRSTLITVWSFAYNGLYKIILGYLCTVYFQEGEPVYFTVHQPRSFPECSLGHIIDILYGFAREAGLPSLRIKRIEERRLGDFLGVEGYEKEVGYSDNNSEYAYLTADFLNLAGGDNLKKRQRLSRCFKNANLSFRFFSGEDTGKCLEIQEEWCRGKDCVYCASFIGCEKKALENMMAIFDDNRYQGLFLYDRGVPVGYSIAEKASDELAFIIFGKANLQDCFPYILYVTAKAYCAGVTYVNLDEDMGNEGLRMVKRHLGPYELWRKYTCTFTGMEGKSL
jgi:hypothetical protein